MNRPRSTGDGVLDDTTEEFEVGEGGIATTKEVVLHDTKLGKKFILVANSGHDPLWRECKLMEHYR